MAKKPSEADMAPQSAPRERVIDALMALAASEPWESITLSEIAVKAKVSLADLRDLYPSKGAVLGSFIRRIDRIVLEASVDDMADQFPRDRVLDIMLKRFDALMPYREALKSIQKGFERDLLGLAALNQQALNSWRYLLTAAGVEVEGPLGALKVQGAILVFARAFRTFLDDEDAGLTKTMAVLDRELQRGEWVMARAEGVSRLMAPFQGFCRAARANRRERRAAM